MKMKYNKEERIGITSVNKIFLEEFDWIFREEPINDFGIDAFVEITEKPQLFANHVVPTGRLIGLQIKSGVSYFKEAKAEYFVYRGTIKHLEYWLNHSLPIIIILFDKVLNAAFWAEVNKSNVLLTKKGFKINIPKRNLLNKESIADLQKIGYFKNQYLYSLWRLRAAKEAIQLLIQETHFLYIEIEVSRNPKGYRITLLSSNEDCDNYPAIIHRLFDDNAWYHGDFYLTKVVSIKESINSIIPWAALYYNNAVFCDRNLYEEIIKDAKTWIIDVDDLQFEEEISILENKQLYYDIACSLTGNYYFRLELRANDLAISFVKIDAFLNTN